MPTETTSTAPAAGVARERLGVIDCDFHPYLKRGLDDLRPYMTAAWAQRLGLGKQDRARRPFRLPVNALFNHLHGTMRRDSTTPDDGPPGSDPEFAAAQYLDPCGVQRALLIGGDVTGFGGIPDPYVATTLASAYNDWLLETWFGADERFRAAIVVPAQAPEAAVREIRRLADQPGVAGVFLPLVDVRVGDPRFLPIYEAAEELGLPIVLHPSGTEGVYSTGPAASVAPPTFYVEWHTGLSQPSHANLVSLICHGVFEKLPDLRVMIAEGGVAWLPDAIWRLTANWRGLRSEVPWVKRPPMEYVVEHMTFTTQPFVEPETPRKHVEMMCELIHAERTLAFSADYPHWDFDQPTRVLKVLPKAIQERVGRDNACDVFGSRLD